MRWTAVFLTSALAFAQSYALAQSTVSSQSTVPSQGTIRSEGTRPKPSPTDYDVHLSAGPLDIGAEYMVHSFSNGEQMFLAERFLVAEVAFYPVMKDDTVTVDLAKFGLRLNHKNLLPAQPANQVAGTLRQSPWESQQQRGLSGGVGAGPIDIPMGQPGQYPGGGQPRGPTAPRAPDPDAPPGVERTQVSAEAVLIQTALPHGPHKGPVSGFVYFYYTGKSSSLKSVELEYGGVSLKLK